MASSLSSAATPQLKYDVFISFNGEDTGYFSTHLYEALCRQNIPTFINDDLIRGYQISPSLLHTITKETKISVIILSERYASHVWCLQELVKILERHDPILMPVFYGVDPPDIRNQTGTFGNGFAILEERYKDMPEILQKWRDALSLAAGLSGFTSAEISGEAELIEMIALRILKRLNGYNSDLLRLSPDTRLFRIKHELFRDEEILNIWKWHYMSTPEQPGLSHYENKLVAIHSRSKCIEELLRIGEPGVRKVGIFGSGGIGKTTVARFVLDKYSLSFESSYFIQNIREESEKSLGLSRLRQELNSTILGDRHPNRISNFTTQGHDLKNVFIVFDDVTSLEQVEYLSEDLGNIIGLRSRIIITTRDERLLKMIAVDHIYELKPLNDGDGFKLLLQHAFGPNHPFMEFYIELSHRVLRYCKGVPLTIKTLGCFLFGMTTHEWARTINYLEMIPGTNIYKALKISYYGLNLEERCIYLDIACFFKGCDRDLVEEILDVYGFRTKIGIDVLLEKSLISVSSNTITMHDIHQEMGREIVRSESIFEPGKRSRLWDHKDIYHVLSTNTGGETIRSICLDTSEMQDINLSPTAFEKMRNLRFLKVYGSHDNHKVHGFEGIKCDFPKLRCLYWYQCPTKSLLISFNFHRLVALDMPYSNVEQICFDFKVFVSLKHINLSFSKHLRKISNLLAAPRLESLILEGCPNLHVNEIWPAIHKLEKLAICKISKAAARATILVFFS